jgi:hypothetical protein
VGERLGEFLVARGAITEDELARALAVLPHFGGRLGDTLVGLELMRPLDAFRHLADQVRAKLVDVVNWSDGRYRWYGDRANPWPALPLRLDTFEILGGGAALTPYAQVAAWARTVANRAPVRVRSPAVQVDAFGIGAKLAYVHALLDGRATVGELGARHSDRDRTELWRLLRLLVETELAAF